MIPDNMKTYTGLTGRTTQEEYMPTLMNHQMFIKNVAIATLFENYNNNPTLQLQHHHRILGDAVGFMLDNEEDMQGVKELENLYTKTLTEVGIIHCVDQMQADLAVLGSKDSKEKVNIAVLHPIMYNPGLGIMHITPLELLALREYIEPAECPDMIMTSVPPSIDGDINPSILEAFSKVTHDHLKKYNNKFKLNLVHLAGDYYISYGEHKPHIPYPTKSPSAYEGFQDGLASINDAILGYPETLMQFLMVDSRGVTVDTAYLDELEETVSEPLYFNNDFVPTVNKKLTIRDYLDTPDMVWWLDHPMVVNVVGLFKTAKIDLKDYIPTQGGGMDIERLREQLSTIGMPKEAIEAVIGKINKDFMEGKGNNGSGTPTIH